MEDEGEEVRTVAIGGSCEGEKNKLATLAERWGGRDVVRVEERTCRTRRTLGGKSCEIREVPQQTTVGVSGMLLS